MIDKILIAALILAYGGLSVFLVSATLYMNSTITGNGSSIAYWFAECSILAAMAGIALIIIGAVIGIFKEEDGS